MIPQENKRRKPTTEEEFDKVLLHYSFGYDPKQMATKFDLNVGTCQRICKAYEIVKAKDWKEAEQYIKYGYAFKFLDWAATKMGVEIPKELSDMSSELNRMKNEAQRGRYASEKEAPEPVKEPTAVQNENLYLCKVLEALAKQNELLEQLMDVVIPKYAVDLKDNVNVNIDLVTQRLRSCEEKLEKISFNTRKRGA